MTGSAPFDVVVFDLGGVLVRIARTWAEAHALAGLEPHPIVDDPVFLERRVALGEAHQDGSLDSPSYYRLKAEASGGAYSPDDIGRIIDAWTREEYAGVGRVLDALEVARIETAALSNTNPAHWARLDGTAEYPTVARLHHRYASHLLRLLKPDPRIYEACDRALKAATGLEDARVLFFDDSLPNVEAARASGWVAELVDDEGDTAAQILRALRAHRVLGTT